MSGIDIPVRDHVYEDQGKRLPSGISSVEEAVIRSGLGWRVEQRPIWIPGDGSGSSGDWLRPLVDEDGEMPFLANVRSDNNLPLGVVTPRYTTVQNLDAFSFLDSIFGSELFFESAGELMGGRRVWMLLRIPDPLFVGGDAIWQYVFVSNSHDGKSSVVAAMTPERVLCANMLTAEVNRARSFDASRVYTLRHLGDMKAKLAAAAGTMETATSYYKDFKRIGDRMAMRNAGSVTFDAYMRDILPLTGLGDRARRNRQESWKDIAAIFNGGSGTQGNSPRTVWAMYNAAIEWADWHRDERKDGGRFQRALDDPGGFKNLAWEQALRRAMLR